MNTTLTIYGIACVLTTVGWRAIVDQWERASALRAQCEQYGHDWADPIRARDFGTYSTCRRCNRQRHRRHDGSWTD